MIWNRISEGLPKECETVLTQHIDDLYPITARYITGHDSKRVWSVASEGAEDGEHHYNIHRYLLREPTHWMPLPDVPAIQEESVKRIELSDEQLRAAIIAITDCVKFASVKKGAYYDTLSDALETLVKASSPEDEEET